MGRRHGRHRRDHRARHGAVRRRGVRVVRHRFGRRHAGGRAVRRGVRFRRIRRPVPARSGLSRSGDVSGPAVRGSGPRRSRPVRRCAVRGVSALGAAPPARTGALALVHVLPVCLLSSVTGGHAGVSRPLGRRLQGRTGPHSGGRCRNATDRRRGFNQVRAAAPPSAGRFARCHAAQQRQRGRRHRTGRVRRGGRRGGRHRGEGGGRRGQRARAGSGGQGALPRAPGRPWPGRRAVPAARSVIEAGADRGTGRRGAGGPVEAQRGRVSRRPAPRAGALQGGVQRQGGRRGRAPPARTPRPPRTPVAARGRWSAGTRGPGSRRAVRRPVRGRTGRCPARRRRPPDRRGRTSPAARPHRDHRGRRDRRGGSRAAPGAWPAGRRTRAGGSDSATTFFSRRWSSASALHWSTGGQMGQHPLAGVVVELAVDEGGQPVAEVLLACRTSRRSERLPVRRGTGPCRSRSPPRRRSSAAVGTGGHARPWRARDGRPGARCCRALAQVGPAAVDPAADGAELDARGSRRSPRTTVPRCRRAPRRPGTRARGCPAPAGRRRRSGCR